MSALASRRNVTLPKLNIRAVHIRDLYHTIHPNLSNEGYTIYNPYSQTIPASQSSTVELGFCVTEAPKKFKIQIELHQSLIPKHLFAMPLKFRPNTFQKSSLSLIIFNGTGRDVKLIRGQRLASMFLHAQDDRREQFILRMYQADYRPPARRRIENSEDDSSTLESD